MPSKPLKPINKRWPGQYAFRVRCYTPRGGMIEFETTLPKEQAEALLNMLADQINKASAAPPPERPSKEEP